MKASNRNIFTPLWVELLFKFYQSLEHSFLNLSPFYDTRSIF